MLRKSLKIGAGVLLVLAVALPDFVLPAAAFPMAQAKVIPFVAPGLEQGVILADHRRSHQRYYRYRHRPWNYYGGYHRRYRHSPGIYLNFGVPFGYYGGGYGGYGYGGYGYGGYDYDRYNGYNAYSGNSSRSHVRWCLNRYRSYNPRTDTYMGYDGYRHRCRGPY